MPVINENDTVATDEIRYGDNDRLAARVATMIERRSAGPAVRHRRPLHRPARQDPNATLIPTGRADHPGDRGDGRRRRRPSCRAAA